MYILYIFVICERFTYVYHKVVPSSSPGKYKWTCWHDPGIRLHFDMGWLHNHHHLQEIQLNPFILTSAVQNVLIYIDTPFSVYSTTSPAYSTVKMKSAPDWLPFKRRTYLPWCKLQHGGPKWDAPHWFQIWNRNLKSKRFFPQNTQLFSVYMYVYTHQDTYW